MLTVCIWAGFTGCTTTVASSAARERALEHVRRQNENNIRLAQWREAERAFEFELSTEQVRLYRQMSGFQNRESTEAFLRSLTLGQWEKATALNQELLALQQEAEHLVAEKPQIVAGLLETQQQEEQERQRRQTLGLILLGVSKGLSATTQQNQQNQMLWEQQKQTWELQRQNQQLQQMQMNQTLPKYGIPTW
jgi:hypothetical protein